MIEPFKILLVDDESEVRDTLVSILQRKGFEVVSCSSGDEAYKIFWDQSPFHFIISDMRMPGWSGYELFKSVRTLNSDIPFLLITGYSDVELKEIQNIPNLQILHKPFRGKDLVALIDSFKKEREKAA